MKNILMSNKQKKMLPAV